jgi:hypothetical protein
MSPIDCALKRKETQQQINNLEDNWEEENNDEW